MSGSGASRRKATRAGVGLAASTANRGVAAALLAMASLADLIAVYMAFVHYRLRTQPGWQSVCAIGATINCDTVVESSYGTVADLPLPVLGLWFYALLVTIVSLDWLGVRWRVPRSSALAFVVALGAAAPVSIAAGSWAMYQLGSVCLFCVAVYGLDLGMLAVAWRALRRESGSLGAAWKKEIAYWRRRPLLGAGGAAVTIALLVVLASLYRAYDGVSPICDATARTASIDVAAEPLDIVVYSDFQCAWCRRLDRQLRELRKEMPDLAIRQRHYPLDRACNPYSRTGPHVGACLQARAVLCAEDQGGAPQMGSMIFDSGAVLPEELRALARKARLDLETFESCVSSERTRERLAESIREAKAAGVDRTPTTFVNGALHLGLWRDEDVGCVERFARR